MPIQSPEAGDAAAELKSDLQRYLSNGRDALLWKIDGLSEYDVRRPMTATGTNLLGLVKHVASMAFLYFGQVFGEPTETQPWMDGESDADMWATADESREQIIAFWGRAWSRANATIDALPLDAQGHVAWWPSERRDVTLHRILVHMIAETDRHAGHADILRELIDESVGVRAEHRNLAASDDPEHWRKHRANLEAVARQVSQRPSH